MGYKIAVVGATGNVGREILKTLAEREFPADEVVAIASSRSLGREVSYGEDQLLKVQDLAQYDFAGTDIALFSPGAKVSAEFAPQAAAAGCVVIDNSSQFRMDPDIPLVVPEVNRSAIGEFRNRNIIANPNCSTIQMVVALKPLHDAFGIERVVVATYQSVSGAGRVPMDELFRQTRGIFVNEPVQPENFTKQIAFNAIPHIDVFMDDGATKEEWKLSVETKKILDPAIKVMATCVRVPVFYQPRRGGPYRMQRTDFLRDGARGADRRTGHRCRRPSGRRRICHAGRSGRRGRCLYQPPARRPDGRERVGDVGGGGQSAQRGGPQRRPDRRGAGRKLHGKSGLIKAASRPAVRTARIGRSRRGWPRRRG